MPIFPDKPEGSPMHATRPLRIMTCIHSFEPGGTERVIMRLAAAWQDMGEQVQIVLGRTSGAMRSTAPAGLHFLTPDRPRIDSAWFETVWMMWALRGFIRRERPDILIFPGNSYTVVAVAMKLLLGRKCPPLIANISNDLRRPDMVPIFRLPYRWWLRIQTRFLDRIVGIAEPMRDEIATLMRAEPERIAVIATPALTMAQIERLRRLRAGQSAPAAGRRFVAIGRLAPQKNFALLIKAFAKAARAEDHLTILGEGPERPRLTRLIAELGMAGQIALPGFVDDPAASLATSDIFILSSDYEGAPAVLLEALAAGIPIIATDCCVSMADLLDNGQLGTLIPPRDEGALTAAIATATIYPDHARDAASRAKAESYTIERSARDYVALMRQTLAVRIG